MSPVLKVFLSGTFTANDLHRRLRIFQSCLENVIYDEPEQMRVMPIEKKINKTIKEVVKEPDLNFFLSLPEEVWNHFSTKNLAAELNLIGKEAQEIPVMTLYVPVKFTDKQLRPLSQWVRAEVDPALLFEVLVDPKVVGGCAFVYRDTHFDWSLRRHLRAKRGMVTSLLNAYGE